MPLLHSIGHLATIRKDGGKLCQDCRKLLFGFRLRSLRLNFGSYSEMAVRNCTFCSFIVGIWQRELEQLIGSLIMYNSRFNTGLLILIGTKVNGLAEEVG